MIREVDPPIKLFIRTDIKLDHCPMRECIRQKIGAARDFNY